MMAPERRTGGEGLGSLPATPAAGWRADLALLDGFPEADRYRTFVEAVVATVVRISLPVPEDQEEADAETAAQAAAEALELLRWCAEAAAGRGAQRASATCYVLALLGDAPPRILTPGVLAWHLDLLPSDPVGTVLRGLVAVLAAEEAPEDLEPHPVRQAAEEAGQALRRALTGRKTRKLPPGAAGLACVALLSLLAACGEAAPGEVSRGGIPEPRALLAAPVAVDTSGAVTVAEPCPLRGACSAAH